MPFVYVTEYSALGLGATIQVPQEPPLADYKIAIAAGSTAGAAFNAATRFVRIQADAACSIVIGPAATAAATVNNQRFAANQTEYKAVPQNSGYAVANITNT